MDTNTTKNLMWQNMKLAYRWAKVFRPEWNEYRRLAFVREYYY